MTSTRSPASELAAWYSLSVLTSLFILSYIDRSSLTLFVDPVRSDLGLSDTGFALLAGSAFALFYATMAIPIAIYSDRHGRKFVIVGGVLLWGLATSGCALATSFETLFLLRIGVGLGEAALTPNAWAMIPSLFPLRLRGRAVALFMCGGVLGSGLALMLPGPIGRLVSGILAQLIPSFRGPPLWRCAFLGLGLLTVVATLPTLFLANVRSTTSVPRGMGAAIARIWARRAELAAIFITGALANTVITGTMYWLPAGLMRSRGWSIDQAGTRLGVVYTLAGLAGTFISGWIADRAKIANEAKRALELIAITTVLAVPLLAASLSVSSTSWTLVLAGLSLTLSSFMSTLFPLAIQAKSEAGQGAQTAAWFLLVANLAGFGLGPILPSLVNDYLLRGPGTIGWAAVSTAAIGSVLVAGIAIWDRTR